jgi:hypothetical protein
MLNNSRRKRGSVRFGKKLRKPLRLFVRTAWRFGLGLQLGSPTSTARVLGWKIEDNDARHITVSAKSPIMSTVNSIKVDQGCIRWSTKIEFTNTFGNGLSVPARLIHQRLVPWSMNRAIGTRERQTIRTS